MNPMTSCHVTIYRDKDVAEDPQEEFATLLEVTNFGDKGHGPNVVELTFNTLGSGECLLRVDVDDLMRVIHAAMRGGATK